MLTPPNYIEDTNPFKLAGPPSWFRRKLWEFDASLVIVPSRQEFLYRLAQRRKLRLKEQIVNDMLKEQADTLMLASYGLIPVTTVMATVRWDNPLLFVELANRAPWRLGGADKVNAMLEAQDRQDTLAQRAKTDAVVSDLAKDSWKYYQLKQGLRSHLWSPSTKSSTSSPQRAPALHIPTPAPYRPDTMASWLDLRGH